MPRRGSIFLALSAAMLAAVASAQPRSPEWHEQVLEGVCTLRLAVPQGWIAKITAPKKESADIRITSADGSRGGVLFKALPVESTTGLQDEENIRQRVQAGCEKLLESAVEKRVDLVKIKGTAGVGFLCSVTNANPKPPRNSPRYLTLGYMAIGRVRLNVAVMADMPESPSIEIARAMLRTAQCVPPAPVSTR